MVQEETLLPASFFVELDRSGPVPLYFQLSQLIERAVLDGALPPGSRLENELALAERLGLSRPTVRRAIQELVDKGMLVRRRGVGTQVVHGQIRRGMDLTSLFDDLSHDSRRPETTVLVHETVPASERMAAVFSFEEGTPMLHLRRLRCADGVPLAVLENYLPSSVVDIDSSALATHGLYQLLRSQGVTIRVARQTIGARRVTHEEAKLLNTAEGGPVLTMSRTAFDVSGRAIEYGQHCYRPDLYSFETTLVER